MSQSRRNEVNSTADSMQRREEDPEDERSPIRYTYAFSARPVETDLRKLLTQVTGRTDVENVTEARMKVVTRQAGLHRLADCAPRLRVLVLDGSCVNSLRDLGSRLSSLGTLSVARCNLRTLDGVWGFRSLRELIASDNFIDDPSPCSGVPRLAKLDLAGNEISHLSRLVFLRVCKRLSRLDVARNHFREYRDEIKVLLPQVRELDGESLDVGVGVHGEGSTEGESDLTSEEEEEEEEEEDSLMLLSDEADAERVDALIDSDPQSDWEDKAMSAGNVGSESVTAVDLGIDDEDEDEVPAWSPPYDRSSPKNDPTSDVVTDPAKKASDAIVRRVLMPDQLQTPLDSELDLGASEIGKNRAQESPGKLTTGRVICGNLAASLRTRNPAKNVVAVPQVASEVKTAEP